MRSANIGLAMLCLHCSAQALALTGCNFNCPKRHYLTLAMQLFSSNPATNFHQQVHFCSLRMHIEPLGVQSWTTAGLILQLLALEGTVPSFLPHPIQPVTPPISLAPTLPWQLPSRPKQRKNTLYFLISVCQPGEGTWSSKSGKRKIRSTQLHLQNLPYTQWCGKIYPLLIFQEGEKVHKCANWFILALSPYQQQNVMLAPASSLPLRSVQAPCCSAHRLFVAMVGGGTSTSFLWSAHSLTQKQ